jgi:hypothetical protein
MDNERDDFSKTTKEILAKRVGYLCSNPNCRKPTVGSNEYPSKTTLIGIASHITAASKGGPRYDDSISPENRRDIANGIWLCSNCATLIDKDSEKFNVKLLKDWKHDAELESFKNLNGKIMHSKPGRPILEADLIFRSGARLFVRYSNKNPIKTENGFQFMDVSNRPIIQWKLIWRYNLVVYNNSSFPAFNVELENIGTIRFNKLDNLPKINNIAPLENIILKAEFEDFIEGDSSVADNAYKPFIPNKFNNLQLKLSYKDELRNVHFSIIEFTDNQIINKIINE